MAHNYALLLSSELWNSSDHYEDDISFAVFFDHALNRLTGSAREAVEGAKIMYLETKEAHENSHDIGNHNPCSKL
jgi:hypothetical protein